MTCFAVVYISHIDTQVLIIITISIVGWRLLVASVALSICVCVIDGWICVSTAEQSECNRFAIYSIKNYWLLFCDWAGASYTLHTFSHARHTHSLDCLFNGIFLNVIHAVPCERQIYTDNDNRSTDSFCCSVSSERITSYKLCWLSDCCELDETRRPNASLAHYNCKIKNVIHWTHSTRVDCYASIHIDVIYSRLCLFRKWMRLERVCVFGCVFVPTWINIDFCVINLTWASLPRHNSIVIDTSLRRYNIVHRSSTARPMKFFSLVKS